MTTASPAAAGTVADTCAGIDTRLGNVCRGAEVPVWQVGAVCRKAAGDEPCATPVTPRVSRKAVAAHAASKLHGALALQYELGSSLPFMDTPWLGTHNSYNSASEMVTPSQTDSNQQLSLTDQLRIDMRSLELDVHWFPSVAAGGARAPVLCHARGADQFHAGCTTERLFEDGLREIGAWLDANPDQVVLLYVEDHLEERAAFDAAAASLEEVLGDRLHRPSGAGCEPLSAIGVTRAQVRAAGDQVIVMSSCSAGTAWGSLVFDDSQRAADEGGAGSFPAQPDCAGWRDRFIRFYEDSTGLSAGTAIGDPYNPGLVPDLVARMVRCNVDLLGFDQILPDDGRLDAAVWTWASGEPRASAGGCAAQSASDGRWRTAACDAALPHACLIEAGWTLADAPCAVGAPRTGHEATQLTEALQAAGANAAFVELPASTAKALRKAHKKARAKKNRRR